MKTISVYLNFNGNTEEAFNFYRWIFGGEFSAMQRYKEMPGSDKFPPKDQNKIMHIALPLGKAGTIFGSDVPESMLGQLMFGTNANIMIEADSEDEVYRLFKALSEGGKSVMPVQKMFWGALYGACSDKFGVQWMFNYTYPKQPLTV
jgi:PhnB protein